MNVEKLIKRFEVIEKTSDFELERLLVDIGENLAEALKECQVDDSTCEQKSILKGKVLKLDSYVKEFHRLGYRIEFKVTKL